MKSEDIVAEAHFGKMVTISTNTGHYYTGMVTKLQGNFNSVPSIQLTTLDRRNSRGDVIVDSYTISFDMIEGIY